MQGVVEQIDSKIVKTRFGDKPSYSIKIDGKWRSAGFKRPPCTEGQLIQFDVTMNGKYENVENIVPLGLSSAQQSPQGIQGTVAPMTGFSKDRCIVRQNNLGHAIGILNLHYSQKEKDFSTFPAVETLAEQAMVISRMLELYCMQEGGVTEALDEKLNALLDQGNEATEE